jgi:hypothetical protein
MSTKETVSILSAPAKTHYIAICIFVILFGFLYVFMYSDQFKGIRTKLAEWRTPFSSLLRLEKPSENGSMSKKNDDVDSDYGDESDNESIDEESNNIREVLSPF